MGLVNQLAAQYASQSEDAKTGQHDADGFRSRKWWGVADQRESFRRNRAQGVLIGRRRAAVLIPVDRVANRAAGERASIAQGHKAPAARPRNVKAESVCLVQVITILVSTEEGVGKGHGLGAAAERRGTKLQVRGRQKIGGRGIPVNEVKP